MRYFIISCWYFIRLFFTKQHVDVLFYYPSHFNRGKDNKNLYFSYLYDVCNDHNLTYVVFEEPCYDAHYNRNYSNIPFDFIYWIILFLRKIRLSDNRIGKLLAKTLLRGLSFNNYIVLSQSMLSIFYSINNQARFFDLQHGIVSIYNDNYIKDNKASSNLVHNNTSVLLYGEGFRNILLKYDQTKYFLNHSFVIGNIDHCSSYPLHDSFNNNILVTLQFTDDHTKDENRRLAAELDRFILSRPQDMFYIKKHPRCNNQINLQDFYKYDNVQPSPLYLKECIKICSLHLTSYSTTTFEVAGFGIPTLFFGSFSKMFVKQFNYPYESDINIITNNYSMNALSVIEWKKDFYTMFNQNQFISLLK